MYRRQVKDKFHNKHGYKLSNKQTKQLKLRKTKKNTEKKQERKEIERSI